jgi:hypothetical protein
MNSMTGGDITESQLDGLRKLAKTYRAGEVICIEGEPTRDLMFLLQGAVEVVQADEVVKTIRGHQVFLGQISFFASQRRTATLRAKTRCDIVRIREERIEGLLAAMPTLSLRLIRDITEMFIQKEDEVSRYREYGSHAHNAMRAHELVGVVESYIPALLASLLVEIPPIVRLNLAMGLIDATSSHVDFKNLIMNRVALPREIKKSDARRALAGAMNSLLREKSSHSSADTLPDEAIASLKQAVDKIGALHESLAKLNELRLTVGAENELRGIRNRLPGLESALEEQHVGEALDHIEHCAEHTEKMRSFAALQRSSDVYGTQVEQVSDLISQIQTSIDSVADGDREGTIRRQILEHLRFEI